jgi:hypothetical protein
MGAVKLSKLENPSVVLVFFEICVVKLFLQTICVIWSGKTLFFQSLLVKSSSRSGKTLFFARFKENRRANK